MPATQIRFSRNSNTIYLPLVYFLPDYLIARCPTLRKLPRNIREIMRNEELIKIVDSDQYLDDVMNAASLLAFPHFGFKGWKEDYTGYFPVWKLSHSIDIWADLLEKERGWGLQALYNIPSSEEIPYFNTDYIKTTMQFIVKMAIAKYNWQPILDVLHDMPCHEDFECRSSNAKIDFYRKWYHSRTKIGVMESLDSYDTAKYDEDKDDGGFRHPVNRDYYTIGSDLEGEDFYQKFIESLSEKDQLIVRLREEGLTFEEIAPKLGYKTHSAVVKKMKAIREAYQEFQI